jgi:hypothetical protein
MVFLMLGCGHHESALRLSYLPANAFTVPEDELHQIIQRDGSIPERHWGAPLRALKPLRVYTDRVNIVVAIQERAYEEQGVYFYRSSSSYLPVDEPGRKFCWNSTTHQLEYVFSKSTGQ